MHLRPVVVLTRDSPSDAGAWARLQALLSRGIVDGSKDAATVRVDVFLAELAGIREVRTIFRQDLQIEPVLASQLRRLAVDRRNRELAAKQAPQTDLGDLVEELKSSGFVRRLKPFQIENLASIVRLPHGADFSVPGAGKTSVALANYALNRARGNVEQLLVIGPIAAFQAWKDDLISCFSSPPSLAVHAGSSSLIPDRAEILLTNYNRVASDYDRIRDYVSRRPTQVVLDEAHRMKRGALGVHGRAVLDLAYAARRRDILTGTPAPQGAFDLIALMRFLYPGQDRQILPASAYVEQDGRDEGVLRATSRAISQYFVRTPKSRLGLPPTTFDVVNQPMGPIQQAIYDALLGQYRGIFDLPTPDRRTFDQMGRVLMYLLECASNPLLLVAGSDANDEDGFAHPPMSVEEGAPLARLLTRYREYETPWKYEYVLRAVEQAAARGEKVLVWSTFVRNLKALAKHLAPYEPAVVHGGIPPEDGAPPGSITREAELNRFRSDPKCSVLLANPAACGEGVSLHHWCHHAIYLDRTFNAGHYLQSQDRIHRLGLQPGTLTRFTLLISAGSIDEGVDGRLREKVVALSTLMDDPGLVAVALPETDENHNERPAFADDFGVVASHLRGNAA